MLNKPLEEIDVSNLRKKINIQISAKTKTLAEPKLSQLVERGWTSESGHQTEMDLEGAG